jgi:hypothetical protein
MTDAGRKDKNDTVSHLDREALDRCVALTLAEPDKGRVEQVRSMLADRDWLDVAQFCSYHRQIASLKLLPWEDPPCVAGTGRDDKAARLAGQLLTAGLSVFEPDPARALKAVKARA